MIYSVRHLQLRAFCVLLNVILYHSSTQIVYAQSVNDSASVTASESNKVDSSKGPNPSEQEDSEATVPEIASTGIKLEGAILKTIDSTTVSAQVAGVLSETKLKEGALVKQGEILAKIHDEAYALKLEQLKSQVEISKRKTQNTIDKEVAIKNRQVAETEYERALSANQRVPNTYPLNEIDRLKLVAERSRLEVARAEYNIEMAALDVDVAVSEYNQTKEMLSRHTIQSPVNGMIVGVDKKLGEWVEPGMAVFRIVRTDTLRIEGLIPANADNGTLMGRSANIELVRGKQREKFVGKVVFVSPDANPVNSLVRVFIEVENPVQKLRPGLQVQAYISKSVDDDKGNGP